MRVDHRRAHTAVARRLLHHVDVDPAFQQMPGKRMPQRVRRDFFAIPARRTATPNAHLPFDSLPSRSITW